MPNIFGDEPVIEAVAAQPITARPEGSQRVQQATDMAAKLLGTNRPRAANTLNPLDLMLGPADAALSLGTAALSQPVAGMTGIAKLAQGDLEGAPKAIEDTATAFARPPATATGAKIVGAAGNLLKPIGDLFDKTSKVMGDFVFEQTDSPALATFASVLPAAAAELLGVKGTKGISEMYSRIKTRRLQGDVATAINDAVPTITQLKDTARGIFKEIDEVGGTVKPEAYHKLISNIDRRIAEAGADYRTTPKAVGALSRMQENLGQEISLGELDILRKVASDVSKNVDLSESSKGAMIVDSIDDFLDTSGTQALNIPEGVNVGAKYKAARQLWGRARRSELVQEAFEKARNSAGGFEKGLVPAFRSILNNKRQKRYFSSGETAAMQEVVRGGRLSNVAQFLGKFDVIGKSPGLMGTLALTSGVATMGPGGLIIPFIGNVSNKLGNRMVRGQAKMVDQVIRAGKNANKITEAYIRNTPKMQRSSSELAQLLMRKDVSLDTLADTPFKAAAKSKVRTVQEQPAAQPIPESANIYAPGVIDDINDLSEFGKLKSHKVYAEGRQDGIVLGEIKLLDDVTPKEMPVELTYRGQRYTQLPDSDVKSSIRGDIYEPEAARLEATLFSSNESIDTLWANTGEELASFDVYALNGDKRTLLGNVRDLKNSKVAPDELEINGRLYSNTGRFK